MTAPPPGIDPVDVAAAYPAAPVAAATRRPDAAAPRLPDPASSRHVSLADRLDAADAGVAEVVLSAEQLTAIKQWTVSGAVRFRRRIKTYTRTVEVTVRREELEVEMRDIAEHAGAWVGTDYRGPAVAAPPTVTGPGVFTLREEVPEVTVTVHPYERVTVHIDRVTDQVQLQETKRREQATVSGDTGAAHPPGRG